MQQRKLIIAAILVASFLVALNAPASAQLMLPGDLYIGAQGGWTKLLDVTNNGHPTSIGPFAGQNSRSIESFDDGFNVGGRAGFKMGPWRLEGELSYRANDTHDLQMIVPRSRPGMAGNAERHSVAEMANLIYDFDLGLGFPVTPQVGGGICSA